MFAGFSVCIYKECAAFFMIFDLAENSTAIL